MSESLGKSIVSARKARGLRASDVCDIVGISTPTMSAIENNTLKHGPDAETVVKIADALGDRSILITYLENNPVYKSIIPKIFPDLNNIKKDPAIIFSRFADEAQEAVDAARILSQMHSDMDPASQPNYCATLRAKLEQIVDVQRCAEILFLQLIAAGILSETDRCEIHAAQQHKCEEKGHHKAVAA